MIFLYQLLFVSELSIAIDMTHLYN
jgi:hypothetical protein